VTCSKFEFTGSLSNRLHKAIVALPVIRDSSQRSGSNMADMDVFAAMGISGFGKATKKKQLDPARFDKSKRDEVSVFSSTTDCFLELLTLVTPSALLQNRNLLRDRLLVLLLLEGNRQKCHVNPRHQPRTMPEERRKGKMWAMGKRV
jgi:hypothetical protein